MIRALAVKGSGLLYDFVSRAEFIRYAYNQGCTASGYVTECQRPHMAFDNIAFTGSQLITHGGVFQRNGRMVQAVQASDISVFMPVI